MPLLWCVTDIPSTLYLQCSSTDVMHTLCATDGRTKRALCTWYPTSIHKSTSNTEDRKLPQFYRLICHKIRWPHIAEKTKCLRQHTFQTRWPSRELLYRSDNLSPDIEVFPVWCPFCLKWLEHKQSLPELATSVRLNAVLELKTFTSFWQRSVTTIAGEVSADGKLWFCLECRPVKATLSWQTRRALRPFTSSKVLLPFVYIKLH